MGLPPELDRLGTALTRAAERAAARRHTRAARRKRLAGCIAAGLFVFAAMTPTHLDRADQPALLRFAIASDAAAAVTCDRPRGQRFDVTEECVNRDELPRAAR